MSAFINRDCRTIGTLSPISDEWDLLYFSCLVWGCTVLECYFSELCKMWFQQWTLLRDSMDICEQSWISNLIFLWRLKMAWIPHYYFFPGLLNITMVTWSQQAANTTQLLPYFPPGGMGEWIGRAKVRKLMDQDKDSLKGKAKLHMQAKQSKESIHHFPSADKCSTTSRKAGLHHM